MLEDGKPKYCILINDLNFQYRLHVFNLRNDLQHVPRESSFAKSANFNFYNLFWMTVSFSNTFYQQVLKPMVLQRNQENVPVTCIDMIAL